jgi:hypothetical protein
MERQFYDTCDHISLVCLAGSLIMLLIQQFIPLKTIIRTLTSKHKANKESEYACYSASDPINVYQKCLPLSSSRNSNGPGILTCNTAALQWPCRYKMGGQVSINHTL